MKFPTLSPSKFSYGWRLRPTRDWFVVLSIMGILLLASLAGNLWLFARVASGEAIGSASAPAAPNTASIDAVRAVFERRAAEDAKYLNGYHFVDPSQ